MSDVSNGEAPGVDVAAAEDARIVGRMAQGDASALAALYDRHARAVYSLSRRILGDPHDAEDVAQDVFAQAWAQAGRYDARRAPVVTWLLVITRGRAIDRLRATRPNARTSAWHSAQPAMCASKVDLSSPVSRPSA